MKKSMLAVYTILLLIIVGVAYAGAFKGNVTAMTDDKSSVTVLSTEDKKEYKFDCDKGVIARDIQIKDRVEVLFKEEGNIKKVTRVKKVMIGC